MGIHILALIAIQPTLCTGDYLAKQLQTNPVVIRKIIAMLKKAKLVQVRAGVGGASLLKSTDQITLLDIYKAVEVVDHDGELFNIRDESNSSCQITSSLSANICETLNEAQQMMEQYLAQISLQQLLDQSFHSLAQ